jgi:PKD repeat protein
MSLTVYCVSISPPKSEELSAPSHYPVSCICWILGQLIVIVCNTARTWLIFGDPSVMVRTADPLPMTVSHDPSVLDGTTNLAVNCNTNDAFVTLTINYDIIGTAIVSGGVANVNFPAVSVGDTILVTVTAYNKIPYEGIVVVENPAVPYDMQTLSILEPVSSYACSGVSLTPKIVIRNMGINTITSCQVYYQLNSNPEQSFTWSGSLATLDRDTINLPSFVLTTGNHTYRARVAAPNGNSDMNTANDERIQTFQVQDLPVVADFSVNVSEFCETPAVVQFANNSQNIQSYLWDFGDGTTSTDENPSHEYLTLGSYTVTLVGSAGVCGTETRVYPDMILVGAEMPVAADVEDCGGPASFTINATSTGPISWYSDAAGTNLIHTGTSYTTPMLSSSATYYLGTSIENSFFGGKTNNSTTGGYFTASNAQGLIFSCSSPLVLKSVKMYSGATTTQNRTIRLESSSDALIQSVTVSVPPGESRVTLNLNIPVGTNMKLMGPGTPNLWRDGSQTMNIAYPFDIGGVIEIHNSTASGYEQNYYYYFYDWEVEQECSSGLNPVTAYITSQPVAAFTPAVNANAVQFTSNSTGGNLTYIWNFGDGNTSSAANPQHIYQSPGVYNVSLTVSNSCGSHDITQQVNVTTTGIEEEVFAFELYPNPAEQFCMVSSPEIIEELLVVDIHGKHLQSLTPQSRNVKVDVSSFAQGMYFIRITTSEGTYIRPLQVK